MNTMKYKGFIGSVHYSEVDGVFSGRIEGIDGLVTFEGASIQELTEAFHNAVESHLIFCKQQGITPKKSYTGTLNIRISPATHNAIADYAAEAGITINAFIKRALEKAVKNPSEVMRSPVAGYQQPRESKPSMLCEPEVRYGSRDITQFWIPSEDVPLAKALAQKMGWDFMLNYPQTRLETALDEIRDGRVTEYASFDDMLKKMEETDG